MDQNLSLYKIFYTTAKAGNISKAAQELYISQPAISKSIKKLEESMETALFTRSSRGVRLTEDGELLFSHVKAAFQTLEAAENQIRLRQDLGVGHLRIGVSSTLCKYVLLPYLKGFVKLHPHLRITIACQSTHETLRMLESGDLDVGLTGKPERLRGLEFRPLKRIQDTFVATPEYLRNLSQLLPTGKREDVRELLSHGTLMLLDKHNLTRQYLDDYFQDQHLFSENILETTAMDLLIDFAKTDLGIACVIRNFVEKELEEQTLMELSLPAPIPSREIGFLYNRKAEHTPMDLLVQELVDFTGKTL